MKPSFRKVILILLGLAIVYVGYDLIQKVYIKANAEDLKTEMPDIDMKRLDGSTLNLRDIPKDKNTLIIYFSTECHYCVVEIENLRDKADQFKGHTIYLVSIEDTRVLKKFTQKMGVDRDDELIFLQDPEWEFPLIHDIQATPSLFFYDTDHKLYDSKIGAMPASAILKILEQ